MCLPFNGTTLEGQLAILLRQPISRIPANSKVVYGSHCTSVGIYRAQQFYIQLRRTVMLAFLYTPAHKDTLFSNVAACIGWGEKLNPPELGLKQ